MEDASSPCDNFLYGFKGAPSARRAARPSLARSHVQWHRRNGSRKHGGGRPANTERS